MSRIPPLSRLSLLAAALALSACGQKEETPSPAATPEVAQTSVCGKVTVCQHELAVGRGTGPH